MMINGVTNAAVQNISKGVETKSESGDFTSKFWDMINSLNDTQVQKQQLTSDVMTGKSDDTTGMMVISAKASLEMDIATTIRDKAAYGWNKLMDMQI